MNGSRVFAAGPGLALWLLVSTLGCSPEKPPAPEEAPAQADAAAAPATATFKAGETPAVLTFAGERGAFRDASKIEDVPEDARGMVRVTLLGGQAPPPGQVWVANLRTPGEDGAYALSTVPRDLFEELALGQGLSSKVELPDGIEPPKQVPTLGAGELIVYKTAWCGVCKKLEDYLRRKGVRYEAKDIEKDPAAAAELQAKAQARGIATGSVPVVDLGGELMVGFDRAKLEKMLPASP